MAGLADLLQGNVDNPQAQLLKAQTQADRLTALATEAGIDPSLQKPRESALMYGLNVLSKPRQMVEGILDSAFVRGDLGNVGIFGAAGRGMDERITGQDILRRAKVESPVARGVLGFAGDVLLDPLSWLAIGPAKGLATAGNKGLTEFGTKVLVEQTQKLKVPIEETVARLATAQGVKATDEAAIGAIRAGVLRDSTTNLDQAFQSAHEYWSAAIDAQRLEKAGKSAQATALYDSMALKADKFKDIINKEDVGKIFSRPRIAMEQNIPFLGHIMPEAKLTGEAGQYAAKFEQGVKAKGFFAPKKLSKSYEFSDNQIAAYRNIMDTAGSKIAEYKKAVTALADAGESLPVVGKAVKGINSTAKMVGGLTSAFTKTLQNTFLFKTVIGEKGWNANVDRLNKEAGIKDYAIQDALSKFKDVSGPENKARRETIAMVLDRASGDTVEFMHKNMSKEDQQHLVKYIQDVRNGLPADHAFMEKYKVVDQGIGGFGEINKKGFGPKATKNIFQDDEAFGGFLDRAIKDANLSTEDQAILGRLIKHLDGVRNREIENGIQTPFLAYYLPHSYGNFNEYVAARKAEGFAVDAVNGAVKGFAPKAQKARTYATLKEAQEAKGLIGNKDPIELYAYRLYQSEMAIAKKQYFNRFVIENGMKGERFAQLLSEAQFVDSPVPAIAEKAKGAKYLLERERMPIPNLMRHGSVDEVGKLGQVLHGDFNETVRQQLLASGEIPKDFANPQELLKELAGHVELDGQSYILPTDVAEGFKQTLGARDWLKANRGPEGKAFLGAMDASVNFYKRAITYPWPAYYVQNMVGDRIHGFFADGFASQDPGTFIRHFDFLTGKKTLVTPGGISLDKNTLKSLLGQNGIKFSSGEYLDFMENTSNFNLDKMKKSVLGIKGNLAAGDPLAALSAAHGKMQDGFENFFRASQFMHHLEKGSTVNDAARMSQDALINYRALSPNEASIARRFYMFYGWTSKATQKSISNLFFAPGNLTKQLSFARAAAETFSDPKAAPSPDDYDRKVLESMINSEGLVVGLGKDKEGNPLVGRVANLPIATPLQQFSMQLPRNWSVGEMVDAGLDSAQRTAQKQFASANPIINAAAQLITGKNLYFNKDLSTPFLRRVPQLAEIGKKLGVYEYTKIPLEALDATTNHFLKAVPDGKGYAIADPGRFWALTNLIPGMSRILATGGSFADMRIPTDKALLRYLTGVRVDTTSDPEKSYLYDQINYMKKNMEDSSFRQIIENQKLQE